MKLGRGKGGDRGGGEKRAKGEEEGRRKVDNWGKGLVGT